MACSIVRLVNRLFARCFFLPHSQILWVRVNDMLLELRVCDILAAKVRLFNCIDKFTNEN